ncbi:Hsp20/alpha crystallin family protein [Mucilaginibacter sp. AK015]|uniref:Hsp20/alpha crystallin family protein n=1 Tax=Mucilaginibacter sp. AK015 TaxID=2723072 RepID=UPI001610A012|nr:Hsp20/alpha crystallin family protein [Mucilaginibacter sp. AK015]MBB5396834.1 HSP20 family protein [Mucilaginibacter sp. AK015]
MKNQSVTKIEERIPVVFEDLFRPWSDLFDGSFFKRATNVPAVNIIENKDHYQLALSAPGLKKDDFKVDLDDDVLTISSEKEDSKEEKDGKYTRQEYNYSSFSRSFTLPEGADKEKLSAKYEDGVLKINIPRNGKVKSPSAKKIAVN